jgi:predicted transcriptional regulator
MGRPIDARDMVIRALSRLSDDASLDDLREEFEMMCGIIAGLEDGEAGRTIPNEEVMAEFRSRRGVSSESVVADCPHVKQVGGS